MSNVEVKQSLVVGNGVFTLQNFKRGDKVLGIDDTHVVLSEKDLLPEDKDHCDYLGDKIVLMQSPEVYINHSCDPNTYVKTIDGLRHVIAIHDIGVGQEINYDYAINGYYDSDIICNCGAKRCRGTISPNFFRLPLNLQKEYMPYLDDWFKEKFKEKLKVIQK